MEYRSTAFSKNTLNRASEKKNVLKPTESLVQVVNSPVSCSKHSRFEFISVTGYSYRGYYGFPQSFRILKFVTTASFEVMCK